MINPTEEQQEIIQAAAQRRGSVMVEAGAGCAKTSTLEMASKKIKVPALALAFNKSIAREMTGRLSGVFTVKTMNGAGHSAWQRSREVAAGQLKLDEKKLGRLVSETARERRMELRSSQWDDTRRLVSGAMTRGLVPLGDKFEHNTLVEDCQASWLDIADQIGILSEDAEYLWELSREILVKNIAEARAGRISFDDQVYCPTLLGGLWPQYPVVFVDEDQDLNSLNHLMLAKQLRPDGRLFAVGDKRQAIYGFRGAHGESAEQIRRLRPEGDWTDLPLMTTFRCPKAVVERQQEHVPGYRAWHTNPEGQVRSVVRPFEVLEGWEGWRWEDVMEALPHPQAEIFVLCRNTAPLLSFAMKLLRRQIGCRMQGRDIGKGLVVLLRKLCPQGDEGPDIMTGKISEWQETEISKAIQLGKEEKIAQITDKAEGLLAVLEGSEARSAQELARVIEMLFSKEDGKVMLSTIHRAKGLEADFVLHLDPWRIPSKWAKRAAALGDRGQLEQEFNLRYVAETRTKHSLMMASLGDFY